MNRSYRTKIILVIHVPEVRKTFCIRKFQGIVGHVKGYKSAIKKVFAQACKVV